MFKYLLISSFLLVNGSVLPAVAQTETPVTENPPAETFQPGFWQPVARVETDKPITLKIINDSGILLDYAFTDANIEPLRLEENATRTIENVETPVFLVVYPDIQNENSSRISLKYFVEVTEDNTIELTIRQIESISQGNRTFNLQSSGAIFLY
jgi:hypothetical protein